jgi:hypothetical protein
MIYRAAPDAALIPSHAVITMLRVLERREARWRARMQRFGVAYVMRIHFEREPDGPASAPVHSSG